MKYTEVNILGIYVAPFALMMLAAWLIALLLQRIADRAGVGVARRVWHPALFKVAVYVIVLSIVVLAVGWDS
jgi:protein AaeX